MGRLYHHFQTSEPTLDPSARSLPEAPQKCMGLVRSPRTVAPTALTLHRAPSTLPGQKVSACCRLATAPNLDGAVRPDAQIQRQLIEKQH